MSEDKTWLTKIEEAAEVYGLRSFDNYAQVRSVAEQVRDSLCKYLDPGEKCTFLVPPQGEFGPADYGSGAFSVSGKGFLPLEPISFGLAVKISSAGDFMRIVISARKEGDKLELRLEDGSKLNFELPVDEEELRLASQQLTKYVLGWFENRVDRYDNGVYGGTDIGFDIQRAGGNDTA